MLAFVIPLLVLGGPKPASVPETQLLEVIRSRLEVGDLAGAAAQARELDRRLAVRAPLEVVDLQVLNRPPEGLGMYTTLYDNRVVGEEMYIYAQVRNHGIRTVAGFSELHLVSDLVILDGAGKELARDEGFGESRFKARAPHRDTFVVIALRTKGLEPGRYGLRLILHDRVGKTSAKAVTHFVIGG